jgi:hypothetical protein
MKIHTRSRRFFWSSLALVGACVTLPAHADIPVTERAVLQAMYTSTNGVNWNNNTNWNGAVGTECTWYGVYCNGTGTNVDFIVLNGDNLTGTLPALGDLTELSGFEAAINNLTGAIPQLDQLAKLETFDVNRNQFTGPIPSLTGLSVLSDFEVWNNQLTSLPSLTGLSNLYSFYAFNNNLTGTIPALAGLANLVEFHVYHNQLTGPIPSLAGLAALSEFEVDDNQLSGPIPDLAGVPLTVFRVGGNQLDGTLPTAPAGLHAGASSLCVNYLPGSSYIDDAAWDAATGITPWYAPCNAIFASGFGPP